MSHVTPAGGRDIPPGALPSGAAAAAAHGDGSAEAWLVRGYSDAPHAYEYRAPDRLLRVLDVALGSAALVISAPVLALAVLAVRLSGAPVLYRGARVGRGGHVFTMYKLRTLRPDAEARLGPYLGNELTRLTSCEVTGAGRVLRATKIDELPQLVNVIRGEMSLVGPRPIRPAFFAELSRDIPAYWQRLVVRPGITGLAQLRKTRETSWAEKLAHDLEYIADRSAALYLRILMVTAWLLVSHLLRRPAGEHALP